MNLPTKIRSEYFIKIISDALAKAADSFSKIAHEQVEISVPSFELVQHIDDFVSKVIAGNIDIMVQSEIHGDLYGQTILLFSNEHIDSLENVCFDFEIPTANKKEIRRSFLLEISNILTGAIVTEFANTLHLNLYGSVPLDPILVSKISKEKLILSLDVSYMIFTVYTSFVEASKNVSLPMMLIFDYENLTKIMDLIENLEKK